VQGKKRTEIEVPRRVVWAVVAALALVAVAALGLLGRANSPRDGEGRPLLLTPERRAILRYLEAARGWAERLAEAGERLDGLMPVGSAPKDKAADPPPTPAAGTDAPGKEDETPPEPEAQPADLYRRAHEAQAARTALEDLAREAERARVPDALVGLHGGAVLAAVEAHLDWADGVLAWIGAPASVDPGSLAALRDEARDALASLEELLTSHIEPQRHGGHGDMHWVTEKDPKLCPLRASVVKGTAANQGGGGR
jgi:hypothetical protein